MLGTRNGKMYTLPSMSSRLVEREASKENESINMGSS